MGSTAFKSATPAIGVASAPGPGSLTLPTAPIARLDDRRLVAVYRQSRMDVLVRQNPFT
jgi:hypothetical protein